MSSTPRTAFDAEAGTTQGRIVPTGWTAPDGTYAYVLGSDRPHVVRSVGSGDAVEIAQTADWTGVALLRWRARFLPAADMPPGVTWDFVALVDGVECIRRTLTVAQDRSDLALPMGEWAASTGIQNHTVAFRLELAGAAGVYAVELPAVYLDALVLDTATAPSPALINRDPEPGETGVASQPRVRFEVASVDGASLDPALLDAWIDGVQVIQLGVVLGSATGTIGASADGLGLVVDITPAVAFGSSYSLALRAVYNSLDVTYTVTTADTVAPYPVAALALDPLTVRLAFDEPMNFGSSVSLDYGLAPTSYTIALVSGAPAVTPTVVAVAFESATSVVLTLDRYATQGALYRVSVGSILDAANNAVVPPDNVATFTGYAWSVPEGRDIDLFGLLPESIQTQDESGEHRDFLGVLQELFDLFFALLDQAPEVWDPDTAPEGFVDLMLAELGNPFELALSLTEKRRLVQILVPIYQTKGTGPGIVGAIRLFTGLDVSLRVYAWAPYPIGEAVIGSTFVLGSATAADLYTFEVVVSVFLSSEQRAIIREILDVMMVAHEHYRLIEPTPIVVVDHWQLGYSLLSTETFVH